MNAKLRHYIAVHYSFLSRILVVTLGCTGVFWGGAEFPVFFNEASIIRIADRIIAGDHFKGEVLARRLPVLENIEVSVYCRPIALRSSVILRIYANDIAASKNDRGHIDERKELMASAIRSSLSCSPADPFLWLVLYWIDRTQDSYRSNNVEYLRKSYRLGPNEGWIALMRNRIAFENFQKLPSDLTKIAINEFTALVENKFYEPAADIFISSTRAEQKLILTKMEHISTENRRVFANILHNRGYNVPILGIAPD
jgi:hypothetical protein